MKSIRKLSFVSRIGISMLVSLLINVLLGYQLSKDLSGNDYTFVVEMNYPSKGSAELYLDTGNDFNQTQKIIKRINKGVNLVSFDFNLATDEQLKFLRLDFGSNNSIKNVEINSAQLSINDKILFDIKKTEIREKIVFSNHILDLDDSKLYFSFDVMKEPFDPYLVFQHLNELIYPLWLRTLLLVLPWIVLFIFPLINWIKQVVYADKLVLLFVSVFLVSITLKDAWVTFSTLLLLGFGIYNFYKKRLFKINLISILVLFFFLIPLVLIGKGDFSKLAIPIGFLFFGLIGMTIDFSTYLDAIKKNYINIYFLLCSILIVSWSLLILYNGYYYNISLTNYFSDIKKNVYAINFWLLNSHTTYFSFFIVIGAVFNIDLYLKKQISIHYTVLYFILSFCVVLILGSRFSIFLYLITPFLFLFSVKNIAKLSFPLLFLAYFLATYFISSLDAVRTQLWKTSWLAIKNNLWTGAGTGSSERLLLNKEFTLRAGYNHVLNLNHSHNQYLTYILENGLIGLFLFLLVFGYLIFQYYRLNKKYMLIIGILILLLMLFESPFKTSIPLYFISFLLVIFSDKKASINKENN